MINEMPYGERLPYEEYAQLPMDKRLIVLTKNEDERARELHEKNINIDLKAIYSTDGVIEKYPSKYSWTDREKLMVKNSGLTCMVEQIWDWSNTAGDWENYLRWALWQPEFYKRHDIDLALNAEDIKKAKKNGRQTAMLSIEDDLGMILGEKPRITSQGPQRETDHEGVRNKYLSEGLDRINILHKMGYRILTMSYIGSSYIGQGDLERYRDVAGLTNIGVQAVRRMNEVGMIIDCVHSGNQTVLDTIEASQDPIIISHTGAKALMPKNHRMVTDEVIHAIGETRGMIGITCICNYLSSDERQGVWNMIDHVDHIVNLVGADHVGIGEDKYMAYQWNEPIYRHYLATMGLPFAAPYMEGQDLPDEWSNITRCLVSRGYSDKEIAKIVGGNALRIMEKVIK